MITIYSVHGSDSRMNTFEEYFAEHSLDKAKKFFMSQIGHNEAVYLEKIIADNINNTYDKQLILKYDFDMVVEIMQKKLDKFLG